MGLWALATEQQLNHSHDAAAWLVRFLVQIQMMHPGLFLHAHMFLKKLVQDGVIVEECIWEGTRCFLASTEVASVLPWR